MKRFRISNHFNDSYFVIYGEVEDAREEVYKLVTAGEDELEATDYIITEL